MTVPLVKWYEPAGGVVDKRSMNMDSRLGSYSRTQVFTLLLAMCEAALHMEQSCSCCSQ